MKQLKYKLNKVAKLPVVLMLCLLPSIVTSSCRINFTLNGAAIDYNVYHTIHVGDFPIRAALVYAPLQTTFENELLNYISRNTRLQTTDGPSDLSIEGEITQYSLTPQAVTEDAYASKTRLTIGVRVKYIDNQNDKNSIDQTFTAYRDFDATQLLIDVQDQLCQEISQELVDLIFNATLGNW